jgi:hypothetical protein
MAQGAIQSQMKIQSHVKRSDSEPGVYSKISPEDILAIQSQMKIQSHVKRSDSEPGVYSKISPEESGADSILRRCFRSLHLTLFPANLDVDRLQRLQATLSPSGEKAKMTERRWWIVRSHLAWYGQIFAAVCRVCTDGPNRSRWRHDGN